MSVPNNKRKLQHIRKSELKIGLPLCQESTLKYTFKFTNLQNREYFFFAQKKAF